MKAILFPVAINCNDKTCGKCDDVIRHTSRCGRFDVNITRTDGDDYLRYKGCIEAEIHPTWVPPLGPDSATVRTVRGHRLRW